MRTVTYYFIGLNSAMQRYNLCRVDAAAACLHQACNAHFVAVHNFALDAWPVGAPLAAAATFAPSASWIIVLQAHLIWRAKRVAFFVLSDWAFAVTVMSTALSVML